MTIQDFGIILSMDLNGRLDFWIILSMDMNGRRIFWDHLIHRREWSSQI